ncbi:unnamed protein product [Lactuca saligna]|uniref:Uncharacterized protein n=1 Tax=Lactuca saligna TaxID=75948 RepID=A0AA35VAJ9_LACSI|nr:unnamed protein product [Lactuca saligna]
MILFFGYIFFFILFCLQSPPLNPSTDHSKPSITLNVYFFYYSTASHLIDVTSSPSIASPPQGSHPRIQFRWSPISYTPPPTFVPGRLTRSYTNPERHNWQLQLQLQLLPTFLDSVTRPSWCFLGYKSMEYASSEYGANSIKQYVSPICNNVRWVTWAQWTYFAHSTFYSYIQELVQTDNRICWNRSRKFLRVTSHLHNYTAKNNNVSDTQNLKESATIKVEVKDPRSVYHIFWRWV